MDKIWFKKKKRAANETDESLAHTIGRDRAVISRIMNGKQAMTTDQARLIAGALDTPMHEIMFRAGLLTEEEVTRATAEEGDDEVFAAHSDELPAWVDPQSVKEAGQICYIVSTNEARFANINQGDILVADQTRINECQPGDTVIASITDWKKSTSSLQIRTFEPPSLASVCNDGRIKVSVLDFHSANIAAKIVGVIRGT